MSKLLKRKLCEYLEIKKQHNLKVMRESKLSEKQIQEYEHYHQDLLDHLDDHGLCFGSALSSAAMDQMGKMDWWHQGLVNIANWDGTEKSLTPELDTVINLAINYIIPSHASTRPIAKKLFPLEGVTQSNILVPDAHLLEKSGTRQSYLEISCFDEKKGQYDTKTVKQRTIIGGEFDLSQLTRLLDEKIIAGNLCLIHTESHALHLKYDVTEQTWVIHHSNYKHKKLKNIRQKFATKEEAAQEILNIVNTPLLLIEIASFNSPTPIHFPEYARLLEESGQKVASGWSTFISSRPDIYSEPIRIAEAPEQTKLRAVIVDQLQELISFAPSQISGVLRLAQKYPDMLAGIVDSLRASDQINPCNLTSFCQMDQHSPEAFHLLRRIAQTSLDDALPESKSFQGAQSKLKEMFDFYDTFKMKIEDKSIQRNLHIVTSIIFDKTFWGSPAEPELLDKLRQSLMSDKLSTPLGFAKAQEIANEILEECDFSSKQETSKNDGFVMHLCRSLLHSPTQLENLFETEHFRKLFDEWSHSKKTQPSLFKPKVVVPESENKAHQVPHRRYSQDL